MRRSPLRFCVMLLAFGPALGTSPAGLQTQPPQYRQQATACTLVRITPSVYEVRGGSGANGAVIVGEDSVILVDAKMTPESAEEILVRLAAVTDKPVSHIVLTHSDGDHVNGLPGLPGRALVVSHDNTYTHLAKAFEDEAHKACLPEVTFSDALTLYSGNMEIRLLHFGPAHTDGDAVIHLPQERIAIVGDLLFFGRDPLIHRHKNGNSFGLAKTLEKLLMLDAEVFLSGHAEPAAKAQIEELLQSIRDKQQAVADMIKAGKSLAEILSAYGLEEPSTAQQRRWPSLVEIIHSELTEKH